MKKLEKSEEQGLVEIEVMGIMLNIGLDLEIIEDPMKIVIGVMLVEEIIAILDLIENLREEIKSRVEEEGIVDDDLIN